MISARCRSVSSGPSVFAAFCFASAVDECGAFVVVAFAFDLAEDEEAEGCGEDGGGEVGEVPGEGVGALVDVEDVVEEGGFEDSVGAGAGEACAEDSAGCSGAVEVEAGGVEEAEAGDEEEDGGDLEGGLGGCGDGGVGGLGVPVEEVAGECVVEEDGDGGSEECAGGEDVASAFAHGSGRHGWVWCVSLHSF